MRYKRTQSRARYVIAGRAEMDCSTVKMAARGLLPPLTVKEQQTVASRILFDWSQMTQGKAGATLTATRDGVTITARSKPLEVIAFRMAQYRAVPLLFGLFIRRHDDGADVWRELQAHFEETFPEVEL